MKTKTGGFCPNLVLTVAIALAAVGCNAAQGEAPPDGSPGAGKPAVSPLPATTPPEIIKPVPLSDLKSADAVFKQLDHKRRGYVTRHETKDLIGFEDAFRAVDRTGSGRLTPAQFRKAWALYKESANK